jgi:hypothetical protein
MDRTASYLQRGRKFENVDLFELALAWGACWDTQVSQSETASIVSDLEIELELRGVDLPYEVAEIEPFAKAVAEFVGSRKVPISLDYFDAADRRIAEALKFVKKISTPYS